MKSQSVQKWSSVPSLDLKWLQWGEEYIVFNASSGDVHLLNPIAAESLKIIENSSVSLGELTEKVAQRLDIGERENLEESIYYFLLKLARLGMIFPVDHP